MKKSVISGSLPVFILREREVYIASSPALDLSSYGATFDEAMKNFNEAVSIFFEECIKMGTLSKVLESCGWEKKPVKGWTPPTFIGERNVELSKLAIA